MKHYPNETTVLGLFKTPEEAHRAIDGLAQHKIDQKDISLVTTQEAYEKEELVDLIAGYKLHEEAVRAGKIGGLTGAVLAGATVITGVLTGGGNLIAAGPLIAVATGAGGLLGGLLGTGFTEEEAKQVDEGILKGEILVVVHAETRKNAQAAKQVFKDQGADRIHLHH